jgi:hypothetical protein
MSATVLDGLDETQPVRDILHSIWRRMFAYVSLNKATFRYAEQFANSPFKQLVNKQEVHGYFAPLIKVIQRGIDQKIIKDVPFEMIAAFLFHPVMTLANQNVCTDIELNSQNIEKSFQMSWDAIKL